MKKAIDKCKSILYNRKAVAGVAESADAHVWGACIFDVRVQVPSPAPKSKSKDLDFFFFCAGRWGRRTRSRGKLKYRTFALFLPSECIFRFCFANAVFKTARKITRADRLSLFVGAVSSPVSRTKKVVSEMIRLFLSIAKAMAYHQPHLGWISSITASRYCISSRFSVY